MRPLLFSLPTIFFMLMPALAGAETLNSNKASTLTAPGSPVIAKGKGFQITRKEMDNVFGSFRANGGRAEETQSPEARVQVLNQLLDIQLVLQKATAAEIAEGAKTADLKIASIRKSLNSPDVFEQRLKAAGMNSNELRTMIFQDVTAQNSLTRQLGIQVTDTDAQKIYETNPAWYTDLEKLHIREILLLTTEAGSSTPLAAETIEAKHREIFKLRQRVAVGEDLVALAKQYDEDPVSKNNAGELPPLAADQVEFGDLASSMKPNEISDVITNLDGYRFFQVIGKIPPRAYTFAELCPKIKNSLIVSKKQELAPAYFEKLQKEAGVEILDPQLKTDMANVQAQAAKDEQAQAESRAALEAELAAKATNAPPTKP